MNTSSTGITCTLGCWLIAALGGLLVGTLLLALAGYGFIQAIFMGGLAFVLAGLFLSITFCKPLPALGAAIEAARPGAPVRSDAPAMPAAPDWAEAPAMPAPPVSAPKPVPVSMPVAPPAPVAPVAAPVLAPEARPTQPARAVAADGKPPVLGAARGGRADDLKIIRGIGPKLEIMLHGMGIYHFDQIADWHSAELSWVDANLEGFKGRASRDHWVVQAKVLAQGGTEAQAFAAADSAANKAMG